MKAGTKPEEAASRKKELSKRFLIFGCGTLLVSSIVVLAALYGPDREAEEPLSSLHWTYEVKL